jgi:hypothetical protein
MVTISHETVTPQIACRLVVMNKYTLRHHVVYLAETCMFSSA